MPTPRPFLAAALLALVLPAAATAATGDAFTLASVLDGATPAWALGGPAGERNPRLEVPPGATVNLTIRNEDGGFHNLKVAGPVERTTESVQARGDTRSLTFTAPASGAFDYFCEYHPTTMRGLVVVQGTQTPGNDAPAPGAVFALLVLAGAALALGRRRGPTG